MARGFVRGRNTCGVRQAWVGGRNSHSGARFICETNQQVYHIAKEGNCL